jgi:hypothetical protein
MPPYFPRFMIALSRASAIAVGSFRSCREREREEGREEGRKEGIAVRSVGR